jgi:hypothetical protein
MWETHIKLIYIDKKSNLASLLEYEANQSREKANEVMERIMKTSGEEKAVSSQYKILKQKKTVKKRCNIDKRSH